MRCSSVQNMPAHSHCGWRRHTPAGWRLRHRNVSSTTTSRGRAQRCNSAFYRRQDSAQLDQMLDRLRSGAPGACLLSATFRMPLHATISNPNHNVYMNLSLCMLSALHAMIRRFSSGCEQFRAPGLAGPALAASLLRL